MTGLWTGLISNLPQLRAAVEGGGFWMPPQASSFAKHTDSLFMFIVYASTIFFIAIVGVMIYCVIKFRHTPQNETTSDLHGNTRLEIIWSLIPGLIMIGIFAWGLKDWINLAVPHANSLDIRVTARKWAWTFNYPKDGITSKDLVVPVGQPVKLTMNSLDVLHSFYVPDFRIKRDALPNRYTVQWFDTLEVGEHNVACTEYCGTQHSGMAAVVKVVSPEDFAKWKEDQNKSLAGPALGEKIFQNNGCTACHNVDKPDVLVGPSLWKKYGEQEVVWDTKTKSEVTVTVDDNYIAESIWQPSAKLVKAGSYPWGKEISPMPSFEGIVKPEGDMPALIEYIKSLK